MYKFGYDREYRRRRRRSAARRVAGVALCIALIGVVGAAAVFFGKKMMKGAGNDSDPAVVIAQSEPEEQTVSASSGALPESPAAESEPISVTSASEALLKEAERLAAGYDYDAAIALLKGDGQYINDAAMQEAVADYEATKKALVRFPISEVTHVFFHSLVADNAKAFDGDEDTKGYNQVMTTISEFNKILKTMYDKGYVLVRLHDLAYETTDENGNTVMKAGEIMLPEGKTPFVMSQDDLCYYPYMTGDGFATRMIIGEDGKPTCEMVMDDGSVSVGSYDLVPLLEDFIREHPDFSYKGARAVLAFTGYEGILGYRTADSYKDSPTYEQDRQAAAEVAQCLKDNGWELASHSWGHLNLATVSWERFKADTDKWEAQVDSLIGPTDIILYPFGADIGDWHPYTSENERYNYLYNAGFRYFCNVDSNKYWLQLGDKYLRQGRRNLDGYRMWKDMTAEAEGRSRKLDDLFRAEDIFDPDRPTPVPNME